MYDVVSGSRRLVAVEPTITFQIYVWLPDLTDCQISQQTLTCNVKARRNRLLDLVLLYDAFPCRAIIFNL